jgi:hypothetical protein
MSAVHVVGLGTYTLVYAQHHAQMDSILIQSIMSAQSAMSPERHVQGRQVVIAMTDLITQLLLTSHLMMHA